MPVGMLARINSLRNLKIAKLEVDTKAATSYGTAISLGALSELTWSPQFVTEDLSSARGVVESDKYINFLNWSLTHGEMDLAAMALALGGEAVEIPESSAGAGDSKALYVLQRGLRAGYIGIIGQPVTVAGGPADFYVCLLKAQVESFNPGRMGGGWAQVTMGGRAFYTIKDEALFALATLEKVTDTTFEVVLQDIEDYLDLVGGVG